MIVDQHKLHIAIVAVKAHRHSLSMDSYIKEQLDYLLPILDKVEVDLLMGRESIIEVDDSERKETG